MIGAYFSPLAPAAVLLLGAFIVPVIVPRLPIHWRMQPLRSFIVPGIVGLAFLMLLGVRLSLPPDNPGDALELLSGWDFSTPDSAAVLIIRADTLSLSFMIAVLLALIIATLLRAAQPPPALNVSVSAAPAEFQSDQEDWLARFRYLFTPSERLLFTGPIYWLQLAGWLAMGAAACLLFVAANSLTLAYAVVIFDVCTALYWIGRHNRDMGVARLFLGVLTATALILGTLLTSPTGLLFLGLALWLRVGLYPFIEAHTRHYWHGDERLIYRCLTLAVSIYLVARVVGQPFPWLVQVLAAGLMLLSGLLTWLTGIRLTSETETGLAPADSNGLGTTLLTWLILTESLIVLFIAPLPSGLAAAFILGQGLSLIALWVTPALGKPHFAEGAWSWPYLPALLATLTLIGSPFLLGWPVRLTLYDHLLAAGQPLLIFGVILAEILALSGLVPYWFILSRGNESNFRRSAAGIVVMVPFLTPVLAPFVLSAMVKTDILPASVSGSPGLFGLMIGVTLAALGLGYFRTQLIKRLKISPVTLIRWLSLSWLFQGILHLLDGLGRSILRVRVILEGQHYMGWAIFLALVGALVIIFS